MATRTTALRTTQATTVAKPPVLPPITEPYGEKTRKYTTAALLIGIGAFVATRLVIILKRGA